MLVSLHSQSNTSNSCDLALKSEIYFSEQESKCEHEFIFKLMSVRWVWTYINLESFLFAIKKFDIYAVHSRSTFTCEMM